MIDRLHRRGRPTAILNKCQCRNFIGVRPSGLFPAGRQRARAVSQRRNTYRPEMSQLTVPIVSTDAATLSDCSALSWDRWFLSHRSECPNVPARRPRCCSAFGSFWIYLAASSRVTSWRPRGSGIGSSNLRVQPRSLMTPPLQVNSGSMSDSRTPSGHRSALMVVQWLQ
jgi:hypothetical protein